MGRDPRNHVSTLHKDLLQICTKQPRNKTVGAAFASSASDGATNRAALQYLLFLEVEGSFGVRQSIACSMAAPRLGAAWPTQQNEGEDGA